MVCVGIVQRPLLLHPLPSPFRLHDVTVPASLCSPSVLPFHPPFLSTMDRFPRCCCCCCCCCGCRCFCCCCWVIRGIMWSHMVIHGVLGAGSQYCCWNSDSSLLALSSDFYQAVMVFDVHRKQQVALLLLIHNPQSIVLCNICGLGSFMQLLQVHTM